MLWCLCMKLMDEYFAGVSGALCFFDGFTHNCGQTNYYITVSQSLILLTVITFIVLCKNNKCLYFNSPPMNLLAYCCMVHYGCQRQAIHVKGYNFPLSSGIATFS